MAELESSLKARCERFNLEATLGAIPGSVGHLGSVLLIVSKVRNTLVGQRRASDTLEASNTLSIWVKSLLADSVDAMVAVATAFEHVTGICKRISEPDGQFDRVYNAPPWRNEECHMQDIRAVIKGIEECTATLDSMKPEILQVFEEIGSLRNTLVVSQVADTSAKMQEMADWAERSERGIQYVKDFMDEISKTLVDAYHLWRDLVVESTVTGRDRRTLAEVGETRLAYSVRSLLRLVGEACHGYTRLSEKHYVSGFFDLGLEIQQRSNTLTQEELDDEIRKIQKYTQLLDDRLSCGGRKLDEEFQDWVGAWPGLDS